MSPNKDITSEVDPEDLAADNKLGLSPSDISVIDSTMSSPKLNQPCVYDMKEKIGGDNTQ